MGLFLTGNADVTIVTNSIVYVHFRACLEHICFKKYNINVGVVFLSFFCGATCYCLDRAIKHE